MILILMATLRSVSLVSEFWGWPRSKASEFGSPGTALHPPAALCWARAQAHRAEGSLGKALRRSQLAQEKDHGCEEGGGWAANFWGYRIGIIFFEWGIPVRRPAYHGKCRFIITIYMVGWKVAKRECSAIWPNQGAGKPSSKIGDFPILWCDIFRIPAIPALHETEAGSHNKTVQLQLKGGPSIRKSWFMYPSLLPNNPYLTFGWACWAPSSAFGHHWWVLRL